MTSMVPVQIVGTRADSRAEMSVVLLADPGRDTQIVPVVVSEHEAKSIARSLSGAIEPQQDTHDLTATLISLAGSQLEEVVITELRDGVLFAELFVETADGMQSTSAQASDGVSLAVRAGAPVFIRERVLDAAGVHLDRDVSAALSDSEIDVVLAEFRSFVESDATPDAVGGPWRAHEGRPQQDVGWMGD